MRTFILFLLVSILGGCIETQSSKGYREETSRKLTLPSSEVKIDSNTVFSIFGNPLPQRTFSGKDAIRRQEELKVAKENYLSEPNKLDNIIWYGRWLGNNGLYFEAIKIFSIGLEQFPTSFELLRHRGERYITIRQFDLALEDFERAAFYSRPAKNEIEKDGIPNRYNKSISNHKFNIYFLLGATHYLKGNYDKAISSFKQCMAFCDNNDLLVKLTDWFYLSYRRIGNEKAAQELLIPINKKIKVLEYVDYLNRLLVYKNQYKPERVLIYAENDDKSLTPILAYGIGSWYLINGNIDKSTQIFERILLNKAWNSLAYIAAEVDLKSLQRL